MAITTGFSRPNLWHVPYAARAKQLEILNNSAGMRRIAQWTTAIQAGQNPPISYTNPYAEKQLTYYMGPDWREQEKERQAQLKQRTWTSDYNDQYAINSIADLVLTTFDPNMKRVDLGGVEDIPIVNIFTGLFTDVLWDKNVRPIVEGFETGKVGEGFGAAGLNLLTNVAETLDILANPIKAVVQGKDALDAMGWGGEGRKNFDYDINTGAGGVVDTIGNILLEVVSDPLNWISFGAKSAITTTAKTVVKEAAGETVEKVGKEIISEAGEAITKETVQEVSEAATKAYIRETMPEAAEEFIDAVAKRTATIYTSQQDEVLKGGMKWFGKSGVSLHDSMLKAIDDVNKGYSKGFMNIIKVQGQFVSDDVLRMANKAAESLKIIDAEKTLTSMRGLYGLSENVQRGLLRSAMYTSVPGMVWNGSRWVRSALSNSAVNNAIGKQLDAIIRNTPEDELTFTRYSRDVKSPFQQRVDSVVDGLSRNGMNAQEAREATQRVETTLMTQRLTNKLNSIIENETLSYTERLKLYAATITEEIPQSGGTFEGALDFLRGTEDDILVKFADELADVNNSLHKFSVHNQDVVQQLAKHPFSRILDGIERVRYEQETLLGTGTQVKLADVLRGTLDTVAFDRVTKGTAHYISQLIKNRTALGITNDVAKNLKNLMRSLLDQTKVVTPEELADTLRTLSEYVNKVDDLTRIDVPKLSHTLFDSEPLIRAERKQGVDTLLEDLKELAMYEQDPRAPIIIDNKSYKGLLEVDENKAVQEWANNTFNYLELYVRDTPQDWMLNNIEDSFNAVLMDRTAASVEDFRKTLEYTKTKTIEYLDGRNVVDQAKAELLSPLDDLITETEKIADTIPSLTKPPVLLKLSNQWMYTLQVSKLQASLSLVADPAVQKILDQEFWNSIIERLGTAPELKETYDNIVAPMLYGIQDTNRLYRTILNDPVLTQSMTNNDVLQLSRSLMDTLNSFAKTPVTRFRNEEVFESFVSQIVTSIESQLNAYVGTKGSNVNALIGQLNLQDLVKPLTAHVAEDDVIRQAVVTRKLMGKLDDTKFYALTDIETTGLTIGADQIHEIAWVPFDEATLDAVETALKAGDVDTARSYVKRYKLQTTAKPTIEVMALDMPDKKALELGLATVDDNGVIQKDLAHNAAAWEEYWNASRAGADHDISSAYRTINDEMLTLAGDREIKLITHNGENFDLPMMRSWATEDVADMPLYKALFATDNVDTLIEARAKNGWLVLTTPERDRIARIVRQHVAQRAAHATAGNMGQRFIGLITPEGISQMRQLGRALAEVDPSFVTERELINQAATSMFAALKDISTFNRQGRTLLINKAMFDGVQVTAEGAAVEGLVKARNISQYIIEYTDYVASNKRINAATLGQWFNISEDFSADYYVQLCDYGRRLADTRAAITNMSVFTDDVVAELNGLQDELLKRIQEVGTTQLKRYEMLRSFGTDDVRSLYAKTQQLYSDYRYLTKLSDTELKGTLNLSDDTFRILADKFSTTATGAAQDAFSKIKLWDNTLDTMKMLEQLDELKTGTLEYIHLFDKFTDSKNIFTVTGKANVQVQINIIEPMTQSLENITKHLKGLNPPQRRVAMDSLMELNTKQAYAALQQIHTMTDTELAEFVWTQGKGVLYVDASFMQDSATYINKLLDTDGSAHLIVHRISEDAVVIGINKNALKYFDDVPTTATAKKLLEVDGDDVLSNEYRNMRQLIDRYSGNKLGYSNGKIINEEYHKNMRKALPEEFLNKIVDTDTIKTRGGYAGTVFNNSVIGNYNTHKMFDQYAALNPFKTTFFSAQTLLDKADAVTKYRTFFFDGKSIFNVNSIFKDTDTNTILNELRMSKNMQLVYMAPDNTSLTGWVVKRAYPTKKVIEAARSGALNVAIVPSVMFEDMARVFNKWEISNPFIKFMKTFIIQPSKSGYLASFGWVMRNLIDSTGKTSIAGALKQVPGAAKYYESEYVPIIKKVIALSPGQYPTAAAFEKVFSEMSEDRVQLFRQVHALFNSEAGGGQIAALAELTTKLPANADWMDKASKAIGETFWNLPVVSLIKDTNDHVERINRLAVYFHEVMSGKGSMEAMSKVIQTHFSFTTTSKWQMYLDLVIPFAAFKMNNLKYWMDMLENNGWLASVMRDVLTPIMNRDEYSGIETADNRSLQYNILAGNLVLDDNTTVKLSLSIMDSLGMLMNPADNLLGTVGAWLSVPFNMVAAQVNGEPWDEVKTLNEVTTNLPIIGPQLMRWYNIRQNAYTGEFENAGSALVAYERTGNTWTKVLPSIFGGVQRLYYFSYPGADKIYTTGDYEKFKGFLTDGAVEIVSLDEFETLAGMSSEYEKRIPKSYSPRSRKIYPRRFYPSRGKKPRRRWTRKTYHKRTYHKRVYAKKGWANRVYHNASYIPRTSSAMFNIMSYNAVQRNPRVGGRPPILYRSPHTSRNFYKKIYTGRGKNLWKNRLLPTTPYTLKYRIAMAWSYLR